MSGVIRAWEETHNSRLDVEEVLALYIAAVSLGLIDEVFIYICMYVYVYVCVSVCYAHKSSHTHTHTHTHTNTESMANLHRCAPARNAKVTAHVGGGCCEKAARSASRGGSQNVAPSV